MLGDVHSLLCRPSYECDQVRTKATASDTVPRSGLVNPSIECCNMLTWNAANAVSRVDNLSFLEDIVPRTTTVREFKSRRVRSAQQDSAAPLQNGQTTLDASRPGAQRPSSQGGQPSTPRETRPYASADGMQASSTLSAVGEQPLIFEHYEPNGSVQRDETGDVEMS